ncbi:MAG: type IV pilus twitching motility protein PilT [Lachnospiraceae bacterium]|nr:type IV pilus twitching motility protein PilT [Lachnospira sp.]MBR6697975.1 type IV pilus twitching motility protein PilT [Lachnospiraceae bacterium]
MLIEELLRISREKKASDLHLTVGIPPRMRINGALMDMDFPKLMPEDTNSIVNRMLTIKQKEVLLENGEIDFSYSLPDTGRYRVNIFRQRGSYAMAFRVVNSVVPKPEDLGIPESVINLYKKKRGLILVTGPTGSGKSTTLASIINKINESANSHIITLEDPIEYLHNHKSSMVNQREIGLDSNSYQAALRAALREDPDVILVGEMRDLETISTAITAAETGHLVLSTLHTIGAASTIDRIIDVFPPHQQQQIRIQLSMVLECVISQQLIPSIDNKRRVAAFEVMHGTVAIKNLIRESKTFQIPAIIQTGRRAGMITMDDAIYELYSKGMIGREQALMYAQDATGLEKKLGL